MTKLAIKGHPTRGNEVIEILEMLGGKNTTNLHGGLDNVIYIINSSCYGEIDYIPYRTDADAYTVFTLEEFLNKYPYKVGDKVITYAEGCLAQFTIQGIRWNHELNKVEYRICSSWRDTSLIQPYKEKTTDKANKAVFDANAQCCDIMNHLIKEETMEEKVESFEILESHCADEVKIEFDPFKFEIVERDNVYYVVKKKTQYPRTYEECCKIKQYDPNFYIDTHLYSDKLGALYKLLICRDAYWKIAGEQMGLGKPFEPDWNDENETYYTISYDGVNIKCYNNTDVYSKLAFPTEEMRDAFYENFKSLIEECKELL